MQYAVISDGVYRNLLFVSVHRLFARCHARCLCVVDCIMGRESVAGQKIVCDHCDCLEWVQKELDMVSIKITLTRTFYQLCGVEGILSSTQPFKS